MSTKLLIATLCLFLSGCFTNDPNKIVVEDRSFNKENAVSSFEVEDAQAVYEPIESEKINTTKVEPEKKKAKQKRYCQILLQLQEPRPLARRIWGRLPR